MLGINCAISYALSGANSIMRQLKWRNTSTIWRNNRKMRQNNFDTDFTSVKTVRLCLRIGRELSLP